MFKNERKNSVQEKQIYIPAKAEIVLIDATDVITSSIGEDAGENDGEWTAFVFDKNKPTGIWE